MATEEIKLKDAVEQNIAIGDIIAVIPKSPWTRPKKLKILGFTEIGTPRVVDLNGNPTRVYGGQMIVKIADQSKGQKSEY